MMGKRFFASFGWCCKVTCVAAMLLTLGSCGGVSAKKLSEQNDQLRREKMQLVRQVTKLRENIHARLDEIKILRRQKGLPAIADGARRPQLASIVFDQYTNAIDTDRDGVDDSVRVYLRTLDGSRRFIPVAATVAIQVSFLTPKQTPLVLAEKQYDVASVVAAYRSGITGTHYTFDVPLPKKIETNITQINVILKLVESETGKTLRYQQTLPLDLN